MPARPGVARQNGGGAEPGPTRSAGRYPKRRRLECWNSYHLSRLLKANDSSDCADERPGESLLDRQTRLSKKSQIPRAPLTVAPIIPRVDPQSGSATPLMLVCIDTFYTPPSTYRGEPGRANARNAKLNVWRSAILVIDTLTKYVYVRHCRLRAALDQNDARPHSETARDALVEFRRRARVESQTQDLQIKRLISDAGSTP